MAAKIRPNEKCPCGSGKKYKHCCRKKEHRSTGRVTTKLTWDSLQGLQGKDFTDAAETLIRQKGFDPQQAPNWLGLSEHAYKRGDRLQMEQGLAEAHRRASNAQDWWEIARFHVQLNSLDTALEILEKEIDSSDLNGKDIDPDAYFDIRARLAMNLKRWPLASRYSQAAVAHNPTEENRWGLMHSLMQAQEFDKLLEASRAAVEAAHPAFWKLFEAGAWIEKGESTRGLALYHEHFEEALQTTPQDDFYRERVLLSELKRWHEHERTPKLPALFQALCQRKVWDESDHRERVQLGLQLEQWPEVERNARAWFRQTPSALEARLLEGIARALQGRSADFLEAIAGTSVDLSARLPDKIWFWLFSHLLHAGHLTVVASLLAHFDLDAHESLLPIQYMLWAQQGDHRSLYDALKDTESARPRGTLYDFLWGKSLLHTGHTDQALDTLQYYWTQSRFTSRAQLGIWLAELHLRREEASQALDYLAEARNDSEEIPLSFWFWRAAAYEQQQRFQDAAADLLTLYRHHPAPWVFQPLINAMMQAEQFDQAQSLLESQDASLSPEMCTKLAMLYWRKQEATKAFETLQQLSGEWLAAAPRTHYLLVYVAIDVEKWIQALASCEYLESHAASRDAPHEQAAFSVEATELQQLRRRAVQGLLQAQDIPIGHLVTASYDNVQQRLQEEWRQELAQTQKELAREAKAQLHRADQQYTRLLVQAIAQGEDTNHFSAPQLAKIREDFLTKWTDASPEQRETLLKQHSAQLEKLLAASSSPGTDALQQKWGAHNWMRLPKRCRELLQDAESFFEMLEKHPQQDHAPVLLQWTRAAELLINHRVVEPLMHIAQNRLGLHNKRDLPQIGGKFLQSKNNRLSLGSIPYLLAEQWHKPDEQVAESKVIYNYQVTSGQRMMWESFRRTLPNEESKTFLFDQLPSLCQYWAIQRNKAAHGAAPLSRETLAEYRAQFLLSTPNLFTVLANLPPVA